MQKYIIQFIPIVLIVLFLVFTKSFVIYSNTLLGKLLALCIIIIYTTEDILYGAALCGICILYYHSIYIEGMEDMHYNVIEAPKEDIKKTFEDQYCKKGVLEYKDTPVKTEMITHVFPEINFKYTTCNPCNQTCDYSIIEEKMKRDDEVRKPNDSKSTNWYLLENQESFVDSIDVKDFSIKFSELKK